MSEPLSRRSGIEGGVDGFLGFFGAAAAFGASAVAAGAGKAVTLLGDGGVSGVALATPTLGADAAFGVGFGVVAVAVVGFSAAFVTAGFGAVTAFFATAGAAFFAAAVTAAFAAAGALDAAVLGVGFWVGFGAALGVEVFVSAVFVAALFDAAVFVAVAFGSAGLGAAVFATGLGETVLGAVFATGLAVGFVTCLGAADFGAARFTAAGVGTDFWAVFAGARAVLRTGDTLVGVFAGEVAPIPEYFKPTAANCASIAACDAI